MNGLSWARMEPDWLSSPLSKMKVLDGHTQRSQSVHHVTLGFWVGFLLGPHDGRMQTVAQSEWKHARHQTSGFPGNAQLAQMIFDIDGRHFTHSFFLNSALGISLNRQRFCSFAVGSAVKSKRFTETHRKETNSLTLKSTVCKIWPFLSFLVKAKWTGHEYGNSECILTGQ